MYLLSNISVFRRFWGAPRVKGYYLLRNYKAAHRNRVERAIREAGLADAICIKDVAYGQGGVLPGKIAVYCKKERSDAESLFFQFYQIAKAEERLAHFSTGHHV